jgi:hypothetical protein
MEFLRTTALVVMLFFELRDGDRFDIGALNLIRDAEFQRPFYGAVILRGDGLHPDDTGSVHKYHSDTPHTEMLFEGGLLKGITMTASAELRGRHIGAMLSWAAIDFSRFAFDLLAHLNGTYRQGYASSFHGLDIRM